MQLVGPDVTVVDVFTRKYYDTTQVISKFGVQPEKLPELLSLVGDRADNIPGVPGVGLKGAAKLLTTFGDLETILKKSEEADVLNLEHGRILSK